MPPATSSLPAISVSDARKTFGRTVAVDRMSFEVRRGEMFGLIGPDGAGKTTLLRLLCGLIRPDEGVILVSGRDPFAAHRTVTQEVGYLSQRFSLYGDLSIDENIEFFARLHGVADFASRRERLLELTGLIAFRARLAERLSGGMKQKLALACTLVHEPGLLLLDEPTTGVDPVSRREFWKLLAEFLSEGRTIVLATPYLDEAERCTRVALISEGKLLALDEPSRLQHETAGRIVEVVVEQPRAALAGLRARLGRHRAQLFGDRLHVALEAGDTPETVGAALKAVGHTPLSVRPIVPSLEDVFIAQLGSTPRAGAASHTNMPAGDHS